MSKQHYEIKLYWHTMPILLEKSPVASCCTQSDSLRPLT